MIYAQFILSAFAIVIAGVFLVKYADEIAEITKLGKLFVGSIFLAGATSLPELFVDLNAIKNGLPDLAVGDLYGSSIFNLLILAIADLLHRGSSQIFSRAASRHALSAAMSICVAAIAGIAIFAEKYFGGFEIAGMSVGTTFVAVVYLLGLRMIFFDQKMVREKVQDSKTVTNLKKNLLRPLGGYIAAAAVILIVAPFVSESAGQIAQETGLSGSFIGSTLVAFTTSLPELTSTIACVRRGAFDLALGNIFGSNTFNMLLLVPLDIAHNGPLLAHVSQIHIFTCLATVLITSTAIMGQLYQVEGRKRFIEPDAFAVIAQVMATVLFLYFFSEVAS